MCRVSGEGRAGAGAGAPCAPRRHPDYIYQRVVSPEAPTTPFLVTQSGQVGPSGRVNATSHLRSCPPRVSAPCFPALRAARTPGHQPDRGRSGPWKADPARDARPGITGVLSRCAGRLTPPSPCVFAQVRERWWFPSGRPRCPGRRGHGDPAPDPPRPPRPALPHPTGRPARPPAFAACLSPGPVGRRTRPTGRSPPAVGARLNLRPVRRRARVGRPAPSLPSPSPPV